MKTMENLSESLKDTTRNPNNRALKKRKKKKNRMSTMQSLMS